MATKSKFEDTVLRDLKRRGISAEYEKLKLSYDITGLRYIPDLVLENGIIVELKGYFRRDAQIKMRAVRETNPGLDIRLVFQDKTSVIQGRSNMTCEDWAIKYKFQYAEGTIPTSWVLEEGAENGDD